MAQKCQLCEERLEIFKSQNQENGNFDLKFEVEGKIIFAHKFMLATVSDVFKRMISDIWNKKETIEIETYSYNDFYDFLKFIYSGKCELNDNNVFVMVDLSEFYHIKSFKQSCDEYLSKKEFTKENTLVFFETLSNYSLPLFEKAILTTFKQNCPTFVESAAFMEASKETVKKIVSFQDRFVSEETLFETVYKWVENQVIKKQNETNEENLYMNDAIKAEIAEFLPYFKFKKMGPRFLTEYVVQRGFLFSHDKLSNILGSIHGDIEVKVTNSVGNSISGNLQNNSAIEIIKTLKNRESDNDVYNVIYWKTKCKKPSTPSPLKQRAGIEWYLIYFNDGSIGVVNNSFEIGQNNYLLTEMIAETDFKITSKCKIEIE